MNIPEVKSQRALITGASSGIGLEMAREFARKGHPLVITSTNETELRELAQTLNLQFGVEVRFVAANLLSSDSAQSLYNTLHRDGVSIDILVNNAGIAHKGHFYKQPLDQQLDIVRLNIESILSLTRLFVPDMVRRGYGRVMNTASIAGYVAGPQMSVYHATKSFLLSFSAALATELAPTGVTVTALCPGATETNFFNRAKASESVVVKKGGVMAPSIVAIEAYQAAMSGRRVHIVGLANRLSIFAQRFLPEAFLTKMAGIFYEDVTPVGRAREVGDMASKGVKQYS